MIDSDTAIFQEPETKSFGPACTSDYPTTFDGLESRLKTRAAGSHVDQIHCVVLPRWLSPIRGRDETSSCVAQVFASSCSPRKYGAWLQACWPTTTGRRDGHLSACTSKHGAWSGFLHRELHLIRPSASFSALSIQLPGTLCPCVRSCFTKTPSSRTAAASCVFASRAGNLG